MYNKVYRASIIAYKKAPNFPRRPWPLTIERIETDCFAVHGGAVLGLEESEKNHIISCGFIAFLQEKRQKGNNENRDVHIFPSKKPLAQLNLRPTYMDGKNHVSSVQHEQT